MKPMCIIIILIAIALVVFLIVKAKKCTEQKEVTEQSQGKPISK